MGRLAVALDGVGPMILSGPRSWIVHATISAAPPITVMASDNAWNAF